MRDWVETTTRPSVKRLAYLIVTLAGTSYPHTALSDIQTRVETGLNRTANFGFREARREIEASRRAEARVLASYQVPDAGRFATVARGGLFNIRKHLRRRARDAALAISAAALNAGRDEQANQALTIASVAAAGIRVLHNSVIELVGETLNMGRTAGALSFANPPEYALRSEQLDKQTCDACTGLHGEIAQVDSYEFYSLSPPTGCYGGGRCRGIWVFGDTQAAFH